MTMLAPCLASASAMALPIPLLPPVTMAIFPLSAMVDSPSALVEWRVDSRLVLMATHHEGGERRHGERHHRGGAEDDVEPQPGALVQRPHPESSDTIAHLIERDQAPRHRGRYGLQLFLSEADGQRQECRAAQTGQADRQHPERGGPGR